MRNIFKVVACTLVGLAVMGAVWLFSLFLQQEEYISSAWLGFGMLTVLLIGIGLAVFGYCRQKKRARDLARRHERQIERVRAEQVMRELWGDSLWAKTNTVETPEAKPTVSTDEWKGYIDRFSTDGK